MLLACTDNAPTSQTQSVIPTTNPVSWYAGYKLPALLEQNIVLESQADVATLLDKKWYAEFNVKQIDISDKTYTVSSCSDLTKLDTVKLNTLREKENAPFMELLVMCKATKAIVNAKPSQQSFIQHLTFDKTLPNTLPKSIGLIISDVESKRKLQDQTLTSWSDINTISSITDLGQNHSTYVHNDGSQQELELVAKGDFNGDGIEDFLLTSRDSMQGGSYSATRLFLFSKLSNESGITELTNI